MAQSSLDALRSALLRLISSLESENDDGIHKAQSDFSRTVDDAKSLLDQGKIEVDVKGLPAVMHIYATRDLPGLIADEKNHPAIIKELNQFKRVMDTVVLPRAVN